MDDSSAAEYMLKLMIRKQRVNEFLSKYLSIMGTQGFGYLTYYRHVEIVGIADAFADGILRRYSTTI